MVKYPALRHDLIFYIRELADPAYQRVVWYKNGHSRDVSGGLNLTLEYIIDGFSFDTCSPVELVGVIFDNVSEAKAVEELLAELEMFVKLHSENRKLAVSVIDLPAWENVVHAASHAYRLMTQGQSPDRMLEDVESGYDQPRRTEQ